MAGGNHAAEIAQVAVFVIEGQHFPARSVDVMDGFAIGRPCNAVGIGHRAEGFMNG